MVARKSGGRKRRGSSGCLTVAFLVLLVAAGYAAWEALTWPDVSRLAVANPRTTAFIERYRAERRAAGKSDRVLWTFVPYAAISSNLKRAVLVGEDIGFFSHHGFELGEMKGAVHDAIEEHELPRGASTITQQLAKNLWLSPSRNPLRKVKEAALTWQIERHLTKRRILELYLNVVELGPGVYGAEAGARHWFGRSAAELSDEEAAQLAASLPDPEDWHPGSPSRAYRRHVETILRRMGKATWIEKEL
ncbi:MAG: monofunctional biosynthetic peptidoglycan transglycosylase [Acidobacteriia bacterium]|nr:monofunctional biosynthetic peptidoglycan transglycosylase [Terriglobia bacterium]